MATSLNKILMLGRLTADPKRVMFDNDKVKTVLRIAVNQEWKAKNGDQKKMVCYIDVVTWNKSAEACARYLKKGSQVLVEGRLDYEEWEQSDGQRRSKHQIVASSVQFLGAPEAENTEQSEQPETQGGYVGGSGQRSYGGDAPALDPHDEPTKSMPF